ncbi:hypothetical protein CcI49_07840 [Frankia sp. CcI49]|nr:hypothetical protein CcI49_07840 [Frankia sp. CcI49]
MGRIRTAHADDTDRPFSDQRAKRVQSSSNGRDGPDAPRVDPFTVTAGTAITASHRARSG